jgi:phosphatidate cytidylyltransferase
VLLDFPQHQGRGAFLLFFLVMVVACAQIVQTVVVRRLRRRPLARHIDRWFSLRSWAAGAGAAAFVGAALYWITPFKAPQALVMAAIAAAAGTLGEFVMSALKKDAGVRIWGNARSITGAVGLLDRVAPLCFAAPVFFHSVRWYFQVNPV